MNKNQLMKANYLISKGIHLKGLAPFDLPYFRAAV